MNPAAPRVVAISSRDNPACRRWRALVDDRTSARQAGAVWLEGEHLLQAALDRGLALQEAVIDEAAWRQPGHPAAQLARRAGQVALLPATLHRSFSSLPSAPSIYAVLARPEAGPPRPDAPTLVLDRVQDAGNVGTLLRSGAAFGIEQVLALTGTARLWSPKVLRAGMGAHFGLALHEGLPLEALDALRLPMVGTALDAPHTLPGAALPWPCAWVFGHEGGGLQPEVRARCNALLRIEQPGGQDSLNVGAAAAIALYESWRQRRPASSVLGMRPQG